MVSIENGGADRTTAYRAGFRVGRVGRVAVALFFTSILGMIVVGEAAPDSWRLPVALASMGVAVLSAIVVIAAGFRNVFAISVAAYVLLVGAGVMLRASHPDARGALIAIAVATIVAGGTTVVATVRGGRKSKELDRLLFTESTSIAFFATMLGALTYALLESWIDAPRLSMWAVWSLGFGVWNIASMVFKRRYS